MRALCLLLAGCGPLFSLTDDDGPDTDTTGTTDDVNPADDTAIVGSTYWGLTGTLALVEGEVDVAATSIVLESRNETCLAAATLTLAERTVEAAALVAWRLTTTVEAGDCAWPGPTTFVVGFGETSTLLEPGAARAGWETGRSLGLYLRGTGAIRLVGLAATDTMRAGTEPPPTEAPSEGRWSLQTLVGLPVGR